MFGVVFCFITSVSEYRFLFFNKYWSKNIRQGCILAQFWLTWGDGMDSFPGFDFSSLFSNLFSEFSNNSFKVNNIKRCEFCNTSIEEIANTGKLGCENCYSAFYNELLPFIKKVHGSVRHVGKKPDKFKAKAENVSKENKLSELREKLKEAIEKQEFEQAAILRDEINALTKKEKDM